VSGVPIALVSALLWAVGSVLMAVGAKRLHVLPLNLIRCLISTTFFWVLLPFYGGIPALAEISPLQWLWMAVSVLGLLVLGDTLYFRSLDLAGVSWAMPVASISPLWAVLLAAAFVGEPLSWPLLLGALLVVAGVSLLNLPASVRKGQAQDPPEKGEGGDPGARRTGLLLAFLVSVLWAIGQVALKPGTEGIHSVVANCVRQPMGALMLLGLNLARGRWHELRALDRRSWGAIAAASLIGTGLGTFLFVMAIQQVGAGRAAILTSVAPLLALPFSMLWLHERPTKWTTMGTLLTTVGIGLVA